MPLTAGTSMPAPVYTWNAGSVLSTSRWMPETRCLNDARSWSGQVRVSTGMEDGSGLTMKQSSRLGSVAPRMKGLVTGVAV